MHCHLIVSRKDQSNKVKISPLTNHRNTKNGVIRGGFDRKTLFQQAESGFDKLFGYQRDLQETNGTISEKLTIQEQEIMQEIQQHNNATVNHYNNESVNQYDNRKISIPDVSSVFGLLTPEGENEDFNEQMLLLKRKKKKKRGVRR